MRECVVCGAPIDHMIGKATYCSNRCKQSEKYWSDPEKYRAKAKDTYYKTKEKADDKSD